MNADEAKLAIQQGLPHNSNLYAYCDNDPVNNSDPTGYLKWPGEIHSYVQSLLAAYILIYLKCLTYIDYFVRFSVFKYGFVDLYAKKWNEVWEVKPDKSKYYKSGPKQLKKYLNAIKGSKPGRNLGTFTTYYFSFGFYEITIKSNTNDGMIYYKTESCIKLNTSILLALTSFVLIPGAVSAIGTSGLAAGALVF